MLGLLLSNMNKIFIQLAHRMRLNKRADSYTWTPCTVGKSKTTRAPVKGHLLPEKKNEADLT